MYIKALSFIAFINVVVGKDFAIGMFKPSDILVTQDIVFKERFPFRETTLKYGKTFACLITYFRIADRLGYGNGPKVKVIRGGLHKNYIVVKLWSYNQPIAATIQAGCQAPPMTTTGKPKESAEKSDDGSDSATENEDDDTDDEDSATKSDAESGSKEEADENKDDVKEEEEEAEAEAGDDKTTTDADDDEGEGEANENESLRRKNLNNV